MTKNVRMLCVTVLIILTVCFIPAMSVLGYEDPDTDKPVSLSMILKTSGDEEHYASGAEIEIYKVADCLDTGSFVLTDDYLGLGFDPDSKITQSQIDDLVKFTEEHKISGIKETSDENGLVVFDGLSCGMYLVSAVSLPEGFTSFVPFVYYLPYFDTDSGKWIYDGTAEPKISYLEPVDIKVKKVWNDDGEDRPERVTVQLINEDGVYDTIYLNSANNWKYEWKNMNAGKKWSVRETDIPADYQATYAADGFDFTVTNTSQLVQTGQIRWPVPVLVFAGTFLVCAGIIIKVPGSKKDEE